MAESQLEQLHAGVESTRQDKANQSAAFEPLSNK
jgi:hypothetical protein